MQISTQTRKSRKLRLLATALANPTISVGGQAVIEGVMMRSPSAYSVAVRKPDNKINIKLEPLKLLSERSRMFRLPFVRGVIVLCSSLVLGIKALNWSANAAMDEEEEPLSPFAITLTLIFSLCLGIALFVVIPHILSYFIGKAAVFGFNEQSVSFHLIDGVIKVIIFILYIWGISFMPDIKRLFQYHGAEHKSIYAYEAGEELTVENARKHTTLHPRCGTSFLFFVILVGIIVFSAAFPFMPEMSGMPKVLSSSIYIAIKMPLLLPIAGISYEIIRLSGQKKDSYLINWFIAPGLWLQKITTSEPDDEQLQVAITSISEVLSMESGSCAPGVRDIVI